MQAIYTAASGLKNQQTRLDTVAANIANAETVGYKSTRVDFKDALYAAMDSPLGGAEMANLRGGTGVLIGGMATDFTAGALQSSGGLLDFAMTGSGFFTVEGSDGERLYTRNGCFNVSGGEAGRYLVTAQGYYVLDGEDNRISLPEDMTGLGVTPEGVITTTRGTVAALGIADFSNPEGLTARGNTYFAESAASGPATFAEAPEVVQGSLEGSNVEMAQEMTLLIRSQRAYSLASRALQTADDMEGLANNMR